MMKRSSIFSIFVLLYAFLIYPDCAASDPILSNNESNSASGSLENATTLLTDAIESAEPRKLMLHNLTRCSTTELKLRKESLQYTWKLTGFIEYFLYMKKFRQAFEIKTEDINFKTDLVDGKWYFKISGTGEPIQEDVGVSATYTYIAKLPKKLSFHMVISLLGKSKKIDLPSQISAGAVVMQQRLYNRRGYSSYLEYVHTFNWISILEPVNALIAEYQQQQPATIAHSSENGDATLHFAITAYFPEDPIYTGFEYCEIGLNSAQDEITSSEPKEEEPMMSYTNSFSLPPYVKHSNSMLHDDRFSDVRLRAKDQVFNAHKIILATSSPAFSAIFDNITSSEDILGSKNFKLQIEGTSSGVTLVNLDMDPEPASEMLRYIYTGRVDVKPIAEQLIIAADALGLNKLEKICENFLHAKTHTGNALTMYKIGMNVGSPKITRRAFSVLKENKSKMMSHDFEELTSKHPRLMFELFVS